MKTNEKMSDDELYKIAKAKNQSYSDEEALSAFNFLIKREKPDLSVISSLKLLSHSEIVREKAKDFLYG